MKKRLNFVLLLALGAGVVTTGAAAQSRQPASEASARLEYATFDPAQAALLRQVDWDDQRRCDGDHDRDDRGCYQRGRNQYRYPAYYGNGYYAAPYCPPNTGWYDRQGHWHAYDRDRDRDRRRHDDDDRR